VLHVVAQTLQLGRQELEQPRIGRRIVVPEIVGFVHHAAPEEPEPDAIGHGPRDVRILFGQQRVGELNARVDALQQLRHARARATGDPIGAGAPLG
jgi:hypothetical protein